MFPEKPLYIIVCRAGRDCGSGNIASHSLFIASLNDLSLAQTTILIMSAGDPPAASITRLAATRAVAPRDGNLVQVLCMYVLGAYIGRTYLEAKRRPPYLVMEVLRPVGDDDAR